MDTNANFNALEYALEGVAGTGGAIGGGYLAVKAGQGLLKRKLDRDAKYDGMSSDLDYQSNLQEANKLQDPAERNATLTKLRRDYDDRKWQLEARKQTGDIGGKVALGTLGGAAGYGLARHLVDSQFNRADFTNPIHRRITKVAAAAGALSGYQDADRKYWEGRKEIENIENPEERTNRLRDYESLSSKINRAGNTLKTSAIRAGLGAGIGYVGSKTAGHVFAERPQAQVRTTTTNMNKKIRKSANFALPNLNLHPNVNLGAKVGAGLGLASGLGIGESEQERDNTSIGGRLGKLVGKTAIGGGLGAGAGYGYNKYKAKLGSQPIPNSGGKVRQGLGAAQDTVEVTPQQVDTPSRWSRLKNYLNKDVKEVGQDIRQGIKNTTGFEKTVRKSANFQDSAQIQKLIQKGSTYIPQPTDGVVTLEATLKEKMNKKKKYPQLNTNMKVNEINSMIESGKPTGKYFNKTIRKSALFKQRGLKGAEFGLSDGTVQIGRQQGLLERAGRLISDPIGKSLQTTGRNIKGGTVGGIVKNLHKFLPTNGGQAAKAALGRGNAVEGIGNYLTSKKGAEATAIGTGGLVLGGGLLAAHALSRKPKALEE